MKKIKTYNKKIQARFNQYTKAGLSVEEARELAGETLEPTLNAFTDKRQVAPTLRAMQRRTTTRYVLEQKDKMISGLITMLNDRIGLSPLESEIVQQALRNMTLEQYMQWWARNKDLIEAIFDDSDKILSHIISVQYIQEVKENLEQALGISFEGDQAATLRRLRGE